MKSYLLLDLLALGISLPPDISRGLESSFDKPIRYCREWRFEVNVYDGLNYVHSCDSFDVKGPFQIPRPLSIMCIHTTPLMVKVLIKFLSLTSLCAFMRLL